MMKYSSVVGLLLAIFTLSVDAEISEIKGEKSTLYQLRNGWLEVVVNPDQGGRVEVLKTRDGKNLVTPLPHEKSPGGSGIGLERLFDSSARRDYETGVWKVVEKKADNGETSLSLESTSGPLHVVKRYILSDRFAKLRVEYAIDNPGNDIYMGSLWMVTVPFPEGSKSMTYYFPFGVSSINWPDFEAGQPEIRSLKWPDITGNYLTNKPVRGWAAGLNDQQQGVAVETDFPKLLSYYNYFPSAEGKPTLEWLTPSFGIRPLSEGLAMAPRRPELSDPLFDYIYRTGYDVIPITGLSGVDGVDNGIVAHMIRDDGRMVIRLTADRILKNCVIDVSVGKDNHTQAIELVPGRISSVVLPIRDDESFLCRFKVRDSQGEILADVEKPFNLASYNPQPCEDKDKVFAPAFKNAPYNTEFDTPAIPWGLKTRRALSMLVISPADGHRDIAELLRRANVKLEVVEVAAVTNFNFGPYSFVLWETPPPIPYLRSVIDKPYDVILITSGILWSVFPEDIQQKIREKVEAGAGLVYVSPPQSWKDMGLDATAEDELSEELNSAVPWKVLPCRRSNQSPFPVSVCSYGRGRLISYDYRTNLNGRAWQVLNKALIPELPFDVTCDYNYQEYYFSHLIRALRLAGKDRPAAGIEALNASPDRITAAIHADHDMEAVLTVEVCDRFGCPRDQIKKQFHLVQGKNETVLALEPSKMQLAGDYFINAFLSVDGFTEDWYSVVVAGKGRAAISSLTLAKKAHTRSEPIDVQVEMAGKLDGTSLEFKLTDMYNRVLFTKTIENPVSGILKQQFMPKVETQSILNRLDVVLRSGGTVLDRRSATYTVEPVDLPMLSFTLWCACDCSNYFGDSQYERYHEMGFDEVIGSEVELTTGPEQRRRAELALRHNLNYLPMALHRVFAWGNKPENTVRNPCLRDPEYLKRMYEEVHRGAAPLKDYFPNAYFVADENSLGEWDIYHNLCQSQYCLAAFRDYLKQRYGSLETLNVTWKTRFADWDAVRPYTRPEAIDAKNLIPWIEHRIFMFGAMDGVVKNQYDALKSADPRGNLAISGMEITKIYAAFDWFKNLKYITRAIAYVDENGRSGNMLRSWQSPGSGLGAWAGYNAPVEKVREFCWWNLFNGLTRQGIFSSSSLLRHGDMQINDYGKSIREMISELRSSGVDCVVSQQNREPSQFAVLFSIPSMVVTSASGALGGPYDEKTYLRNFGMWNALIGNMGYQPPNVVAPQQLPSLDPATTPVLVLPLAMSLSDSDIEAVLAFSRKGGCVIADALPGVYLENGVTRTKNPLADFFGVDFAPLPAIADSTVKIDDQEFAVKLVSPHLVLKDHAHALAVGDQESSALVRRDRSAYVNVLAADYTPGCFQSSTGEPMVVLFRKLFNSLNLKTDITLSLPADSEATRYFDGKNRYLGLVRADGNDRDQSLAQIELDQIRHVYDVLNHRYLGERKSFAVQLKPLGVQLLAFLPKPTEPCQVTAGLEGNEIVVTINSTPIDNRSLCRVEVVRPDGSKLEPSCRNYAVDGQLKLRIHPGLEPVAGKWQVKVTNLLSGSVSLTTVDVNGRM